MSHLDDDQKVRNLIEGIEAKTREPHIDFLSGCFRGAIIGILICVCGGIYDFFFPPPPEFYESGAETWSIVGVFFIVAVSGAIGALIIPPIGRMVGHLRKRNRS